MTTIHKDITNFLEKQGTARGPSASGAVLSSYNPIRMLNLLGKLDHEDLDILYDILEETYESGEGEGLYKLKQRCQEHYDRGYIDGYDDGYSTEE